MKGIILAGGSGKRLYPLTKSVSKQLMPIYDKPMIYYPLSVLMLSGIQDVLIISTTEDLPRFNQLLGDGSDIGMRFEYIAQPSPDGIAQAFILGEEFIGSDDVCLILGDNIYYGDGIIKMLSQAVLNASVKSMATIFGYHVLDSFRYGVVDFDNTGKVLGIEEKPKNPKSNYAVTGLYFYPNDVVIKAAEVAPSDRGELEITTVNQMYLDEQRLIVELLGRGFAWLDTGTHESLLEANQFVASLQERQGFKISCPEEIAWRMGLINSKDLEDLALKIGKTNYGEYLLNLIRN